MNSLIDKKDDKKDHKDDNNNKHKSNLLDVRAFTTNQDTLLRRPFRTEIVNPLNRKLHCRSVVNSSIQNIVNNNANASIKN